MHGVASAPKIYQKIVRDTLAGNPRTANITDDCIIGGVGMEDHNQNLFGALDKLSTAGFTLSGKECRFRMPRLTFFGYDLSARERLGSQQGKGHSCRECRGTKGRSQGQVIYAVNWYVSR